MYVCTCLEVLLLYLRKGTDCGIGLFLRSMVELLLFLKMYNSDGFMKSANVELI